MTTPEFYQNAPELTSADEALIVLGNCLAKRLEDPNLRNTEAFRLFNGFYEGMPGLVVDKFGQTLLIKNFDRDPDAFENLIETSIALYKKALPEISAVIIKKRHAKNENQRNGLLLEGKATEVIAESGVQYALDLTLNQDDSFYLDTRHLRDWLRHNMANKSVLNTFAYTGALGISALAGGAIEVIQTDLSSKFLQLAEKSALLNPRNKNHKILPGDYFKHMALFKSQGKLFDCVIIDPPLFSKTTAGEVSLLKNWVSLVNKARPLVGHEGYLILINNALFLSGEALQAQIQTMCESGYMTLTDIIDVHQDITGYPSGIVGYPPVPTQPYNHPTKITITRISRKDGQRAS